MKGRCFKINQEVKLKKDGTPKQIVKNKKKGKKSEVYPFKTQEDIKNMMNYFIDNKSWHCYLLFVLGINMARRVGDTLSLRWEHFYFSNGRMRNDILEINEEKTDKFANPRINKACREAIKLFIEKTGAEPMQNISKKYLCNYQELIKVVYFHLQLIGKT